MKKILVPTDFSDNARSAFLYAVELANQLDASVTVIHCYHPTANQVNDFLIANDDELEKMSLGRLNSFVENSFPETMEDVIIANMVEQKLVLGFAADQLVEISKNGEYDMIVMGATGATGILEKVFGKVSLHVAKHAACPVLLIPEGITFQEVNDIMYASEYESADEELLLQFVDLSKKLDANIHLVHVYDEKETGKEGLGHYLLEKIFQMKAPSLKFTLESITSDSVAHGLEKYAHTKNMDWMVIVKPQRKFWQNLLRTSRTNEIIMKPNIPLMVMHLPKKDAQ